MFQVYLVLFNEANLVNLLETCLYGSSACESLDDLAVDLIDYCVRQINCILSHGAEDHFLGKSEDLMHEDTKDEILRHQKTIQFQVHSSSSKV